MEIIDELFRQNPNLERLIRPDANELEGLAESIQLLRSVRDSESENAEVNFQLAAALVSHSRKSFIEEGVRLMEALVSKRWHDKWSDVVDRRPVQLPSETAHIVRGVAISKATAPPPSDDDDDEDDGSVLQISEASDEAAHAQTASTSVDTARTECAPDDSTLSWDVQVSRDPTVMNRPGAAGSDADASKIRPGRIDDLALYHYYLTIGWIKLKDLSKASSCVEQMLILAAGNKQGAALKKYIEVADRQGTAISAATVASLGLMIGGVAAAAGLFLRGKQKA